MALGSCLPPSQGRTELLLTPGRSSDRRPRAREKGLPRGARLLLSEQLARRGVPAGRRKAKAEGLGRDIDEPNSLATVYSVLLLQRLAEHSAPAASFRAMACKRSIEPLPCANVR